MFDDMFGNDPSALYKRMPRLPTHAGLRPPAQAGDPAADRNRMLAQALMAGGAPDQAVPPPQPQMMPNQGMAPQGGQFPGQMPMGQQQPMDQQATNQAPQFQNQMMNQLGQPPLTFADRWSALDPANGGAPIPYPPVRPR